MSVQYSDNNIYMEDSSYNNDGYDNSGYHGLYKVQDLAEEAQVTDGLIYQKIADGTIKTVPREELSKYGIHPSLRKPKHWITPEEVEKFINSPRTTYSRSQELTTPEE